MKTKSIMKAVFTVLEVIGGVGTIGATGFVIADKVGELKSLKSEKTNNVAPNTEVRA